MNNLQLNMIVRQIVHENCIDKAVEILNPQNSYRLNILLYLMRYMFFASFLVDFFAPNGCEKFSAKDSKILSIHADFITTYYFEFCGFRYKLY